MPDISPLRPEQVGEAKRVIYTTAHALFHDRETLEEAIVYYETVWPLHDIDDFQQSYSNNEGIFLVMSEGGQIIGTGALRWLEKGVGEIKRLWLLPQYQGKGLGYQMMTHILEVARQKGYARIRLETNPVYQVRAIAFYRQFGFYEIPRYGDDPEDMGMELVLK